jgi:hypothetical protein
MCKIFYFKIIFIILLYVRVVGRVYSLVCWCFFGAAFSCLYRLKAFITLVAFSSKLLMKPCYSSGHYSSAFHRGVPGSSQGRVGFVVDKVTLGQVFFRVLRFPLPIFIPPTSAYSSSCNIWGWYNRPEVADVPNALSLIHTKKLKKE